MNTKRILVVDDEPSVTRKLTSGRYCRRWRNFSRKPRINAWLGWQASGLNSITCRPRRIIRTAAKTYEQGQCAATNLKH